MRYELTDYECVAVRPVLPNEPRGVPRVSWGGAGIWDEIMDALAATNDAAVQMIDTSIVRVHQRGGRIAWNSEQHMGRSRGGLTTKIHALADTNGLPVQLGLTAGEIVGGPRPATRRIIARGRELGRAGESS